LLLSPFRKQMLHIRGPAVIPSTQLLHIMLDTHLSRLDAYWITIPHAMPSSIGMKNRRISDTERRTTLRDPRFILYDTNSIWLSRIRKKGPEEHTSFVDSPYASSPLITFLRKKWTFYNSLRSDQPKNHTTRKSIQTNIFHDSIIMTFYVQLQELCDFEKLKFS